MKGEVYGKRDLSPLVGLAKKQSGGKGNTGRGGNRKPNRRK
jgi:small subunit ribosomal protein S3